MLNQVLVSFGTQEETKRVIAEVQQDGTACWCGPTVWQQRHAMRIQRFVVDDERKRTSTRAWKRLCESHERVWRQLNFARRRAAKSESGAKPRGLCSSIPTVAGSGANCNWPPISGAIRESWPEPTPIVGDCPVTHTALIGEDPEEERPCQQVRQSALRQLVGSGQDSRGE